MTLRVYSILFLLISSLCGAESRDQFTQCGIYHLQGSLAQSGSEYELRIFRGSKSEVRLKLVGRHSRDVANLVGKTIEVDGKILKHLNSYQGEVEPTKVSIGIPDAVDPGFGDGFWLKQPVDCSAAKPN